MHREKIFDPVHRQAVLDKSRKMLKRLNLQIVLLDQVNAKWKTRMDTSGLHHQAEVLRQLIDDIERRSGLETVH